MSVHSLTTDTISAVAAILLSLLFSYVPNVKDWFAKQPGTTKRLVVLGSLALAAAGGLALSCGSLNGVMLVPGATACTETNLVDVVSAFIAALVANQSAYSFAPQPKTV
jgi:putative flippase GtrA